MQVELAFTFGYHMSFHQLKKIKNPLARHAKIMVYYTLVRPKGSSAAL